MLGSDAEAHQATTLGYAEDDGLVRQSVLPLIKLSDWADRPMSSPTLTGAPPTLARPARAAAKAPRS